MLTPETIDATARACLQMHRTRTRYHPLDAAVRAAPLDDAYRIQDALHRLLAAAGRGEIAGWKIALTSKAMQQMTGVDQPAAGAIFSTASIPRRPRSTSAPIITWVWSSRWRCGSATICRLSGGPGRAPPWPSRRRVPARLRAGGGRRRRLQDPRRLHAGGAEHLERWRGARGAGDRLAASRPGERRDALPGSTARPRARGKTGDALGHPLRGRGVAGQPPQWPRPPAGRAT